MLYMCCKAEVCPRCGVPAACRQAGVSGVYCNSREHTRSEVPVCADPKLEDMVRSSWETAGKAPGNGRETTQPPLPCQEHDHRTSGATLHQNCDALAIPKKTLSNRGCTQDEGARGRERRMKKPRAGAEVAQKGGGTRKTHNTTTSGEYAGNAGRIPESGRIGARGRRQDT